MESLGYLILYFIQGSLPWQGLKAKIWKQKDKLILEKKKVTGTKDLCDGLPKEFTNYFNHVRSLQFKDKPNYSYLRKIFRNLFVREGFKYDNVFDWTVLKFLAALDPSHSAPTVGEGTGDSNSLQKTSV